MTTDYRWHVACINWGHDQAPHAMSYLLVNGEMQAEVYHATWGEAIHRATGRAAAQAAERTARGAHATTQATARDADRELRRAGEGSAA